MIHLIQYKYYNETDTEANMKLKDNYYILKP